MHHPYCSPVMNVTNNVKPQPPMQHSSPALTDYHGRIARYLRLSVTDRCNFRCSYCRNEFDDASINHSHILRYEEMLTIVGAALRMGIEKIRLTGGEPFARKGFMDFVAQIRERYPQVDLRITTNGSLIAPHVATLKNLGIKAVNISLDSFRPETFARITGKNALPTVLQAIDNLQNHDIGVKINAVAMRGITDVEMEDFAVFAQNNAVDVRFIEFMPMGSQTSWNDDTFLPATDLLAEAQKYLNLEELPPKPWQMGNEQTHSTEQSSTTASPPVHAGPARMYRIKNGHGRLGIISAMSNHFCSSCNRLRVTSDGSLRTCLFADKEHDVRGILRDPNLENLEDITEKICALFKHAIKDKPLGEALLKARQAGHAVAQKKMVNIGG